MTGPELETAFRDFLASELGAPAERLASPEEELLAGGVIDSMGVMQLVAFMEERLGIAVDDEDIVPENFRSLGALTAFASAKLGGTAAAG